MAPSTPPSIRSSRGCCAADPIIISSSSSSGSDLSVPDTVVVISSATFSARYVLFAPDSFASRGGDGATSGQLRRALRHWRSASPTPSVRSTNVVTAASSANGSGDGEEATSGPAVAARHGSPSSVVFVSARSPGRRVVPAPSGTGGGDDEATSRRKRKARYRKWDLADERKVLEATAELRRDNLGVLPQASVLLKKLRVDGALQRRGVDSRELSTKVNQLKKKFVKAIAKVAAKGGMPLRKYRNQVLYEVSMEVWPDLLPGGVAAAVLEA